MKKKVITLLLSLVLASGSIGNIQVLAADTTGQEAEPVQEEKTYEQEEESVQEEEPAEEVSEPEEEVEPAPENEEQVQEDEDSETAEAVDEEEADISEEAAAEVLETEETEITDESVDALADVVDSGSCGVNATWTLTGEEDDLTLTISGSGDMKDYYNGNNIPWASKRMKIKKVVVEDGITSVGEFAFYSLNKMTNVSLPNSLTNIGMYAFRDCSSLTDLTIPDGVTSIELSTFNKCSSLSSITIPNSVTRISDSAFKDCSSLTSITIPDSVTSMGNYVLSGCSSLTSVTIMGSVMNIGYQAFEGCSSLTSVTIPDTVTSIDKYAFQDCSSLTSVTIPDSVTSIDYWAFSGCSSLKSITIPDSVTSIGHYAFDGCSSLTSITIPGSVETIDDWFSDCKNLKKVIILNGVTSIRDYAFQGCSSLESITIPASMTSIGDAFYGCNNIERIYISDLEAWCRIDFKKYIPGDLYLNNKLLTEVIIPYGITEIDDYRFRGRYGIKSVTIPNSVEIIGDNAFCACEGLTSVTIPDSVFRIGRDAFADCDNLTSITIPGSLTNIGYNAFFCCNKITSITISGVKIIGGWFSDFGFLESVTILNGVTSIRDNAFSGCGSLKSITIPSSVTSIGSHAFEGCHSLRSITIPNSVTSISRDAFPKYSWDPIVFVIFTQSPYVKNYCNLNNYAYFDKTAPSIAKLTAHNGSDICVYFEKKDECSENWEHTDFEYEYVIGYQLKYADNKNMTGAKSIMLKDKKAASKVITGLKNGKTYYVQLQHYFKSESVSYWSKWSPIKSVTVGQTPYPTNVSKLSTYIGSHIKVDWTKTAGASGYHIKYADNSSMTGAKEVMVKGNSTFTKTLTGLKNGKTYYVKIQTYRTVSGKTYWSSWSPAKSITVDQKPYGSSISKLTNPSSKAMKITWDKASSASGYHIQYATNSSMTGAKDIMVNNKDTLSKTVTGLTKGKTYYVRIQTFRKVSGKTYWSSWSKAKQIKITK